MGDITLVKRLRSWTKVILSSVPSIVKGATQKRALIFVCYRWADSEWATNYLVQELRNDFEVFQDIKTKQGYSFREQIKSALDICDVFLVLIGEEWLTVSKSGMRRIDDPFDDVRIEIETALARVNLPIYIVLIGGAKRPNESDLPKSLKSLMTRNALELRSGKEPDVRVIVDIIKKERPYKPSFPKILFSFVAVALALACSVFWNSFMPHAIRTTGADALKTYLESIRSKTTQYASVNRPSTPVVISAPDNWVRPDPAAGKLSFFGLYSIFDDVKAIQIVDPRDNSTRSIDLLQKEEFTDRVDPNFIRDIRPSNLDGVPVPFGATPISIKLDYKNGRPPETRQLEMVNPNIECINLEQTDAGKGGKAPKLYAAYEPVDQELVFLPIAPNGTVKVLYALRNGGYQVFDRGNSRLWGIFQRSVSHWKQSDTIKLLFQLGDARESGPFEYSLTGIPDMVRRSLKQQVLQRWREMIQCKRVAFNFPVPATRDQASRVLNSANLSFVEHAPVLACIPAPDGWSGHSFQSFGSLWAAVREVRFGPALSRLTFSAVPGINVQAIIESPRVLLKVNWRLLMPPDLKTVYVQFVFFDGEVTEPKMIPIEEISLPN